MKNNRILGIAVACCMAIPIFAQPYKATLPYQLIGGKIVVNMLVNGTTRPFIFDTGGQTALLTDVCTEMGLTATDSVRVTDVHNNTSFQKTTRIESLTTPDSIINFTQVPTLMFDKVKGWDCFGADGVIGSDLLQNSIVVIDSKQQTICITSAEKSAKASLRKMRPFVKNGFMPIINIQIAPANDLTVLFDTGCPSLLSLTHNDFTGLQQAAELKVISEAVTEGDIGSNGQAKQAFSKRVHIPLFNIGSTKFHHLITHTATHPYTLLGVKLLEYGVVTIDYPRQRLYFESFNQENEIKNQCHNFDLTVKNGDLYVSTVWSNMNKEVHVGDKVVEIDGTPTRKFDFCESIIHGISELKEKKQSKLTLQTKNGLKKVIYKQE